MIYRPSKSFWIIPNFCTHQKFTKWRWKRLDRLTLMAIHCSSSTMSAGGTSAAMNRSATAVGENGRATGERVADRGTYAPDSVVISRHSMSRMKRR